MKTITTSNHVKLNIIVLLITKESTTFMEYNSNPTIPKCKCFTHFITDNKLRASSYFTKNGKSFIFSCIKMTLILSDAHTFYKKIIILMKMTH